MSPKSTEKHSTLEYNPHSSLEVVPTVRDPYRVVLGSDAHRVDHDSGGDSLGPGSQGSSGAAEPTIMGLSRPTFFAIAWILSLVVAVAASVGGSLGATMGSKAPCALAGLQSTVAGPSQPTIFADQSSTKSTSSYSSTPSSLSK